MRAEINRNRPIVAALNFLMDPIPTDAPAQVIPESRWLKNWAQVLEEISSRSARLAITVAEDRMHARKR